MQHNHEKFTSEENIFQLLLDESLAGYWERNFNEGTSYLSPASKGIFGYSKDELENTLESWRSIVLPEDLEKYNRSFEEHVKSHGQTPHRLEIRHIHKSGHLVWTLAIGKVIAWNSDGSPQKMIGCLIDISHQKEIEENLKISQRQFKDAFESSPIGMALVSLEGKWLMVNKRLSSLLGYSQDELLQITFQDVTHPEDLDLDLGYLNKVVAHEIEQYEIEKRYFHKNGNTIWVQLNVSLVRDSRGNNSHFISQIQDITQRKKAQENLRVLTEKLTLRNQKLGDFAHIASHNLRAPVSNLVALVDMYNRGISDEEKQGTFVHFEKVVNHLSSTLHELIDTLKVQEDFDQSREKINFEEVLQKTREMLVSQIEETNTSLEVDFSKAPDIVYHRPYLESIFLNLISNAIKYRDPARTPQIRIITGKENKSTFLKIYDNGLGINLQRHGHKVFGLHKTFHRHKEAKGFGLFMTRTQVEAMGGKIAVESKEGDGSCFTIFFN